MKRAASIEALIKRARSDFQNVKKAYEASLHEKHIREDLRVSIKNIFENLRSSLDYMAQDIFEAKCTQTEKSDRLYFPIRFTAMGFKQAIIKDFPGLEQSASDVCAALEKVQPYNDPWLGQFNKLNNHNKHQDLVEQARTELRQVTVSRGGSSVSWGPVVTFGSGCSVIGVQIDPHTQLPIPNNITTTQVTIWVDFRFAENNQPVLPFIEASIKHVKRLFDNLRDIV